MAQNANVCSVENCAYPSKTRGYCNKHYHRVLKYGDPHFTKIRATRNKLGHGASVEDRLLNGIDEDAATGCWNWVKAKYHDGYGNIGIKGKNERAHRVAYGEWVGKIPAGMIVCHRCDNPACINPDHLFIGTIQDNIRDKVNKGRCVRGEDNYNAVLSEDDVREIRRRARESNDSESVIGKDYGIGSAHVHQIKHGTIWRHIL